MRRLPALLSTALVIVCLAATGTPTANAADPLTGRLVDATASHTAVAGATVRLRAMTDSGPGAVVDTTTTSASGVFSLDAGASPEDEYYVQVLPGSYQGGYVGGSPAYVQPTAGGAMTYAPHSQLGQVLANPAFIRGRLIDSVTHDPVAGVRVTSRSDNDITQVEGSDVTNRHGVFRITGLECEDDCYLKFNGGTAHETGFRDCNGGVVADWGDACASPIGRIGTVRIDPS